MRGQAFLAVAAAAAALLAAQPASAQQYPTYHEEHVANQRECEQSRNRRTAGGAVIGGLLGAVLGSNVAADGHRGDGTALGAVVGAAAGAAVGRSSARCARVPEGSYDPYYGQSSGNYPPQDNDGDLYGGPYQESGYGNGGYDNRDCRMGEVITRDPYGREYRDRVMMCRGRDGVWRPQ